MASAFQSDAFQTTGFESILSYTTEAATGAFSAAGFAAGSTVSKLPNYTTALAAGGFNVSGGAAGSAVTYAPTYRTVADKGTFVVAGFAALSARNYKTLGTIGAIVVAIAEVQSLASTPEVFFLNIIADLVPAVIEAKARRFGERLTVGATVLKVKSWSYEETDADISGSLQIELANVADRSLITNTAVIKFELGEFINGAWTYQTLVDTGSLDRSDYAISPSGVGSPDTFTFTGTSVMNARLNKVPAKALVVYDPARQEVAASDFEGIYNTSGTYFPPEIKAIPGLTLYKLFSEILETRAGFFKVNTNIPDFPVGIVEFAPGAPYLEAVGGIIGMFEPDFSTTTDALGNLTLWIRDGTAFNTPDAPALRTIPIAQATSLGVANESGSKADALLIQVSQERNTFDFYSTRQETTTTQNGAAFFGSGGGVETTVTTKYRDYFRRSNTLTPVNTETLLIIEEVRENGARQRSSIEVFSLDTRGRLKAREKGVRAFVPQPKKGAYGYDALPNPNTSSGDGNVNNPPAIDPAGDPRFAADNNFEKNAYRPQFMPVESEQEVITYALHPYKPRTYYIKTREISKKGLIYTDKENQQIGADFAARAMDAYRAGNLSGDMEANWGRISTFKETTIPQRNKKVKIITLEYDYVAKQVLRNDEEVRDGEVGINIFTEEQKKLYIFSPGKTAIEKGVESVNMGELPLDIAVALGTRILAQRTTLPHRVAFGYIGIDNTIAKGTALNVTGRAGAALGTYVIESRSMEADANGYFMTLQGRQAR